MRSRRSAGAINPARRPIEVVAPEVAIIKNIGIVESPEPFVEEPDPAAIGELRRQVRLRKPVYRNLYADRWHPIAKAPCPEVACLQSGLVGAGLCGDA